MARIVALLIVAVLAAAPAAGLAAAPPDPTQPPSFEQTPSQSQNLVGEEPDQTQAPPPTSLDEDSMGAREALLIGAGIVALIGGIWFVIARDAKRATAGRVPAADSGVGRSTTRASRRSRRLSAAERRRRKRGRAS
jgi:hypothetical protein